MAKLIEQRAQAGGKRTGRDVAWPDGVAQRRRGPELEDALLSAAWDELKAVGYSNLTMEGVAARAGTSKPVLYRRWPSRALLVLAALRRQTVPIASSVPDTGDLRQDALAVLRHLQSRQQQAGAEVIHGLLAELDDVPPGFLDIVPTVMMTVLTRAQERGELRPQALNRRAAAVPGDLLRHQMLISRDPVPDEFLVEVVDQVLLPLVANEHYLGSVKARLGSQPEGDR